MRKIKLEKERKARRLSAPTLLLLLLTLGGVVRAQQSTGAAPPVLVDPPAPEGPSCNRVITADVVALDQPIVYNRLGALNPGGMMFALRNDVKAINASSGLVAGNVQ